MAAVIRQKIQTLRHPEIHSGRCVLRDFSDDVFAIAKPSQVGRPLADPKDFAAFLTGKARAHAGLGASRGRLGYFRGFVGLLGARSPWRDRRLQPEYHQRQIVVDTPT